MIIPSYVVKNILYRLGLDVEEVKTSSVFIHRGKCPFCIDKKKRLYVRDYGAFFSVKCHHCGYNSSFEAFLKVNYPHAYDELKPYCLESIKDGTAFKRNYGRKEEVKENLSDLVDLRIKMYLKKHAFPIDEVQESKKEVLRKRILEYLETRRIPKNIYDDFYCIIKGPLKGYIGIPFFDETKENIIHVQGRLFDNLGNNELPKYIFLRDEKEDMEIENKEVWGLWRVGPDDPVVICEGTLDACAFKYGISTCGATIGESFISKLKKKFKKRIWCIDSFWIDEEGQKLTTKLLEMGESCFIIPRELQGIKDANQLLCEHLSSDEFISEEFISEEFINENTYTGNKGKVRLNFSNVFNKNL